MQIYAVEFLRVQRNKGFEMFGFKMSWYDFKNYQFVYDDKVYLLCKLKGNWGRPPIKHKILLLLNIHRGRFVSRRDLLEFIYEDQDMDKWVEDQDGVLSVMVHSIREILPDGVTIESWDRVGYRLVIETENQRI